MSAQGCDRSLEKMGKALVKGFAEDASYRRGFKDGKQAGDEAVALLRRAREDLASYRVQFTEGSAVGWKGRMDLFAAQLLAEIDAYLEGRNEPRG